MKPLILIDGGTRTLDLDKATVAFLRRPEPRDNRKVVTHEIYIDDVDAKERLVLKVRHTCTLAGNKPRGSRDEITIYTIIGYDPDKRRWGPEERSAYLEVSWENGKRLIDAITEHTKEAMDQFNGGKTWYAQARPYR